MEDVRKEIESIQPWNAVFDQNYVKKLHGDNVKKAKTKYDLAQMLANDIQNFKNKHNLSRMVTVWFANTEFF